jgi:hypothetical protein
MRYQQPIYIQNESSGVRNKDILNQNMSSDLCVFVSPKFTMSGASKLDCECGCSSGFTLLNTGDCQYVDSIPVTLNGSLLTGYTGSIAGGYGVNGTQFFKTELTGNLPYLLTGVTNGYVIDSSGTTINPDSTVSSGNLWISNNNSSYGRLNNVGVWSVLGGNDPTTENQWIGFSKCVEIETSGVYSIGIAGDNRIKFKINSELFYFGNLSITGSFSIWRVFEVTLSAGTNVIELEGYNDGSLASFGAEIYNVGVDVLSGLTNEFELARFTIFTTKDYRYDETGIPLEFDLGETFGYSCPSGYFLNTCETPYNCGTLVMSSCTIPLNEYYIVDTSATTIPLTFNFTANTDSFTSNSTTFKYEIYKYNPLAEFFVLPPKYSSEVKEYSLFSGTSAFTDSIPISALTLDGQYLVKAYYNFDVCTEYLNKLGKKIDTLSYRSGNEYGLYDGNLDFFFTAIKKAEKPTFLANGSNIPPANQLHQQVILPKTGENNIIITNEYSGFFVVTLNGLVLADQYDYTYTGNVITLSSPTVSDDIITITYTTSGGNTLAGDNINISSPILSGTTNNEGNNTSYYNTTTGKYEIYTSLNPINSSGIIVMINGVTLTNGIDFYQSITNPKRIILEGGLTVGDVITIVYFPGISVINGIQISTPSVIWEVASAPQLVNGYFSLEVSTGTTFNNYYYSGYTPYVVNSFLYGDSFVVSGQVGTTLYYRVKNTKEYETICGRGISSTTYSDTVSIIIQTNSINSY